METLNFAGSQAVWVQHLERIGFRLHPLDPDEDPDEPGAWKPVWECEVAAGVTVYAVATGWYSWFLKQTAGPPVEVTTVGELRRYLSGLGAEPSW